MVMWWRSQRSSGWQGVMEIPARADCYDLTVQMVGVDDHTVAHHADNIGTEDTGGQQVQHELAPLVLDGMTSIVAA